MYAILYVQDVGPAGTGKFYRVQRPLQIKCDHPPVGSVKGDCPAGIRAVGVYDWDSPATNLRVEVYSGALRGQSGSVREFSGTTVNRELTVPMSDLAGVRNGALGIDQRSVTFFVYFINVNDAGNETATQNTYKQLDIGPCNTCQSIPITSATNDNSPQPGEAFKSDFKVYYPDAASAAAAAAAPISLTVSGPSGNQTVPGINKATGTSGSGASIRYFVTGTANFAGMSPTGKNTVVFTAGGSYPVQIMPAGSPTPCPMNISAKPYVSVGIGDVTAGAPIMDKDGVCSAQATSGIAGWNSNQPGYSGAGGKFGVTALGIIVGFASGQSTASSGTGLSFANTANNNPSSGQFGGQFGSGGSCWQPPTENVVTEAASTLNGKTVATGTHQTIHFTGDLYITDNVIYAEGWGSLRDIPSLVIYVDGNIYIDANVTRLDGTYMARPTSATTGGQIYTCATSAAPIDTTSPSYFSTCGKQLVVNGSLIAQKVHLLRTCGTLQQAVGNEPVTTSGGTDLLTCGTGSHAAEVINNGPSDWMGRANMNSLAGDKWDSIVSLPPVL